MQDEKKMRPVDIEADVKEMERRKRVEAIMNSKVGNGKGGNSAVKIAALEHEQHREQRV